MDFRFGEAQQEIRSLARGILAKEVTAERLKAAEAGPDRLDEKLWATLAEASLLGVAVPEAEGGMGLGLAELLVLCEEVGRAVAPAPVLPALVTAGLAVARFGDAAQREAWLRPLAAGELLLSAAVGGGPGELPGGHAPRARAEAPGHRLDGAVHLVPLGPRAARILVPAREAAGPALFLLDPAAPGVALSGARTSTGELLYTVEMSGARVAAADRLAGDAAAALAYAAACAALGACATQIGVSDRALEITTAHLRERVQFGAPIGSFPAVQQRAADAWIDLQALRWTTWRAASRLARGVHSPAEIRVAAFWAASAGSRIANTAQHLHGGLGVDLDYPIHRYFLASKALELFLGGATPQLAHLGRAMAAAGPGMLAGSLED